MASAPLLPRLLFQGQNSRCDVNCSCQRGHKFIADDFSCGSSGRPRTTAGCKLVSSRPALMSAEIVKSSFKVTQDACYYSFDKRTPPKPPRGGRRRRAQEIPSERAGETCDPSPGAAAGDSIWLCSAALFHRPQTRKDEDKETEIRPDIGGAPLPGQTEPGCSSTAADGHLGAPGKRAETLKPPGGLINCHSSPQTCPRFNEPHADNLRLQERENHQMIPER